MDVSTRLEECLILLDDLATSARLIPRFLENDPKRQKEVEARLNSINDMKNKYKVNSLSEIKEYYSQIKEQVSFNQENKTRILALQKQRVTLETYLFKIGETLSHKRGKASKELSVKLEKQISKLAMPAATFQIVIDKKGIIPSNNQLEAIAVSRNGFDAVSFLFSSNKGIEPKLLKEAISGGELSRVMLALKRILSEFLPNRLMVFDEIDAGIGGKTADLLADIISEMSEKHQIMCITHLSQIASCGEKHFFIDKDSSGSKTKTEIYPLDGEARINEIARMLSGSDSTIALKHAEELLKRKKWSQDGSK
jgi:DNA repair protein RecN (Recombination protein N)